MVIFDADAACRDVFGKLAEHEVVYVDGPLVQSELSKYADAEVISIFVSSAFPKECIDALPHLTYLRRDLSGPRGRFIQNRRA